MKTGILLCAAVMLMGQGTLVEGTYKGEWQGASASGAMHLTFHADGKGGFTPQVGFSLGDQEVTGKVLTFKMDGAKLVLVYEFDAQGTMLKSATEATVKGKTIEGTYKTTAGDQDVDAGTWKVTIP